MKKRSSAESREINLKLESYDDIFSDFDIRPYSRRALSVDFLDELKRAVYDKDEEEGVEAVLNVPGSKRNEPNELKIKKRLKDHFAKHYRMILEQKKKVKRRGLAMFSAGVLAMAAAALVLLHGSENSPLHALLIVFLEPAAWFLVWEGMDLIVFGSKDIDANLKFYRKMSHSNGKIFFVGY